jgi:hypothetical protein
VTCRWSVLSYPALNTRMRIDLPTEADVFGAGVLKTWSNSVWRLPALGTIAEYDGTVVNDASGPVARYYRMRQMNMQCIWTVPNDPGPCRIRFEVPLSRTTNWVNAILREDVDGQIAADHQTIERVIVPGVPVLTPLVIGAASTIGNLQYYGDADWYQLAVATSGTYRVQTYLGTLTDTILKLYGPGNQTDLIQQNDNAVGRASRVIVPLNAGTYYVKITAPPTRRGTYRIQAIAAP